MDENLSATDKLAYERTLLANERTFLAYVRTFVGFVAAGVGLIIIVELPWASLTGIIFIAAGIAFFACGIIKYGRSKKRIRQIMQ